MPIEDIQVIYPKGYDSAATILGRPENRMTYTLNGGMSVSSTTLTVKATAGGDLYDLTDLELPCLLVFDGGEIWYIEDGDVDSATQLTISFSQRAQLGTSAQIHSDGEKVHAYFSGKQHEMLINILINMEKFPIVHGAQGSASVVGEAYITEDYDIYVSFDGASFTKLVSGKHTNLDDVPASGTPHGDQYLHAGGTVFSDWHDTQSGDHITGGDDHTHLVDASPVKRIAYGSSLPTGEKIGQIFLKNGDLYFIYDSSLEFDEFFGIPSGSILPFPPASGCPSGWSEYSALNASAYAVAGIGGTGGTGGSNTHTHTVSEIGAHTHTILEDTCTSTSAGAHNHTVYMTNGDGALRSVIQQYTFAYNAHLETSPMTATHTHTSGTQESATTDGLVSGSMVSDFVTDSESTEPAYKTMHWCQKD